MRKRLTLRVNEIRTFELEGHEDGGYCWTIVSNDESVAKVQIKKPATKREVTEIPLGKSFPTLVEIQAFASGQSIIHLVEKRAWEKDVRPLNSCRVYITVK